MPDQHEYPIELHNWLRVATLGLDVVEREQVRESGLALYRQTLERELKAGREEVAARQLALKALGDPWRLRCEMLAVGKWRDKEVLAPLKEWWALRKTPRPVALDAWLEIATGNLAEADRARVAAEIEAHYQDAVASGREAGLGLAAAERAALEGLGSARLARRRFDRTNLTQEDAKRLESLRRDRRPMIVGFIEAGSAMLIFWSGIALEQVHANVMQKGCGLSLLIGMLLMPTLGARGVRHIIASLIHKHHHDERWLRRALEILYAVLFAPIVPALFHGRLTQSPGVKSGGHPVFHSALVLIAMSLACILLIKAIVYCEVKWLRKVKATKNAIDPQGPDRYA